MATRTYSADHSKVVDYWVVMDCNCAPSCLSTDIHGNPKEMFAIYFYFGILFGNWHPPFCNFCDYQFKMALVLQMTHLVPSNVGGLKTKYIEADTFFLPQINILKTSTRPDLVRAKFINYWSSVRQSINLKTFINFFVGLIRKRGISSSHGHALRIPITLV